MKIKIFRLILLVVILLMATAGFFSYSITRIIEVKASMFNLSAQLADIYHWQKWNKQLLGNNSSIKGPKMAVTANGSIIKLDVKNPASFIISNERGYNKSVEYIKILPTTTDTSVLLIWQAKQSGFGWIASKLSFRDKVQQQLVALKRFAENPYTIYGFPIKIVKVTDEVLCATQKTVSKDSVPAESIKLLNNLKAFFKRKGLIILSRYYYISTLAVANNIQLTVALPVKKELPNENGFKFLKFPTGGRLLSGDFIGAFKNMYLIYAAMDAYMVDHHLMKVAQILAAYPFTTDFTKVVEAKVIYPIY